MNTFEADERGNVTGGGPATIHKGDRIRMLNSDGTAIVVEVTEEPAGDTLQVRQVEP